MGRRRLPPTCLRLSLREPASPWCWPEPWGSLQEGREASPGGPHGNRAYGVRGGGAASRPGAYGDARGVCCCVWCVLCVSRVPCSLHVMSTPWSEAARWEGGGPPPPAASGPSWPGGGAFALSTPSLQGRPVCGTSYHICPTRVRAPWWWPVRAPAPSVPLRPLVSELSQLQGWAGCPSSRLRSPFAFLGVRPTAGARPPLA